MVLHSIILSIQMTIPLELSFRNLDRSEFIENQVKERVKRLELLSDEITSCHVVASAPHQHKKKGNHYEVHVEIRVPGAELAVTQNNDPSEAHEDFYVALRDAFDALERRLTEWKEKRRNDVKAHSRPATPAYNDKS
ncbi:MAG: ribosomal subunit interface protein [Porticoccaceae bacterium]|jgi:ribosomal subunit interface protein